MSKQLRQRHKLSTPAAMVAGALLVSGLLAGCGDEEGADPQSGTGADAVSVSGDFGKAPEVKIAERVAVDKTTSETLIEGKGEEVAEGDPVKANIWIGNGYTQKEAYNSYDDGQPAELTADSSQLSAAILDGIVGHTVGSRTLVVADPKDAFGEQGNSALGIGNGDSVIFVIDIMSKSSAPLDGPQGEDQKAPAYAPTVVEKDDVPSGFDFTDKPKAAPEKLQTIPLVEGDGAAVKKGQSLTVNYLGAVYGSDTTFDGSYGKDAFTFELGAGNVIKGWDRGLEGQTVGSRVLLMIPSDLAYGKAGSGEKIPPDSDLVFVIDILAAN